MSGTVATDGIGPKTLIFKAADLARNEPTDGCAYYVIYDFDGPYPPVKLTPAVNKAKAGSAVPFQFSLAGDQGLDVIAQGYPASRQVDCATLAFRGDPVPTNPAGGSGLTYAPKNRRYNYVWKMDKAWASTCRALTLMLADGTQHLAYFEFK